jgi:hypothetical protein
MAARFKELACLRPRGNFGAVNHAHEHGIHPAAAFETFLKVRTATSNAVSLIVAWHCLAAMHGDLRRQPATVSAATAIINPDLAARRMVGL